MSSAGASVQLHGYIASIARSDAEGLIAASYPLAAGVTS
jgi:hypothetical protein